MAFEPIAISTGSSSSCSARGPPVMRMSVPFSAPVFEPVTGASSIAAPFAWNAASTRRTSAGDTVEVSR